MRERECSCWCGSDQWWSLSCDAGAGIQQSFSWSSAKTRTRTEADMTVRLGQTGFKSLTLLRIRSPAWRGEEISQNINPFKSALSTRPGLIKKSIFLISFPIDVWEWVQFPKSKILVFCECSEVGLIGKLDLQKGRVFGLNNQSSDRHRDITTQNTTFITRKEKLGVQPTANMYQPKLTSSEGIFSVFLELVRAII